MYLVYKIERMLACETFFVSQTIKVNGWCIVGAWFFDKLFIALSLERQWIDDIGE